MGTPQNMSPGMLGGPGGNQRGSGRIPSLLDINTKKPQGKRGFTGPRDQGGFKKQRLTPQKVFFSLFFIILYNTVLFILLLISSTGVVMISSKKFSPKILDTHV